MMERPSPEEVAFLTSAFPDISKEKMISLWRELEPDDVETLIPHLIFLDTCSSDGDDEPMSILSDIFPEKATSELQEALLLSNNDINQAISCLLPKDEFAEITGILAPKNIRDKSYKSANYTKDILEKPRNEDVSVTKRSKDMKALCDIFPHVDISDIADTLAEFSNDVERAAAKLFVMSPVETLGTEEILNATSDHDLAVLIEMFPQLDVADLSAVLNQHQSIDSAIASLTDDTITKSSWAEVAKKPGYLKSSADVRPKSVSPNPSIVSKIPQSGSSKTKYYIKTIDNDCGFEDAAELRARATLLTQQRNELYSRAAQAFKRGQLTGKGTAAYYSSEGRDLDSRVKDAHKSAAIATIESNKRRHGNDPTIIDVHGLTVKEALEHVQQVSQNYSQIRRHVGQVSPRLHVITGIGRHSENNVAKLYPALVKFCLRDGWTVCRGDHEGSFTVYRK